MTDEVDQFYADMDSKKGKLPPTCTGEIVELHVRTGKELFGDKILPYEGQSIEDAQARKYLQVIVQTPYEFDVREAFSSSKNPQSKMGKFIAMYGDKPKIGMKVNLIQRKGSDGRDYYRLFY